jgi:methylaspartate ammonia-lyase
MKTRTLPKMKIQLIADKWVNTIDDIIPFIKAKTTDMIQVKMGNPGSLHNAIEPVLACKSNRVGAFLDSSCAESSLFMYVLIHFALATRLDIVMALPGIDVDGGNMLTRNEMTRTLGSINR